MIRHIVLFTANDKGHIDEIIEGLLVLTKIPHARRLEVACNRKSDQLGNDIDVVVYGEFETEAQLAAYKAHDLYQESIKRVRPLRELRFAADYDISTDVRFLTRRAGVYWRRPSWS
ncbi:MULTISPECIES: Dabb family protein [unclassified Bradyrhizobium]|uniref:Dabb family protein n=1 Tax=unclassified Bradyrhizobium TaxID=2631580 RepID=UPI0020B349EE|nr:MULTISPECIES: Dabb family protein [unclassified Bradyrhizobium]MCP3396940.1 Dabb family protein [Bradyrhizobium sp. CCGB20]MCP3405457.1 Dabb family protein [Bradyrhizobium sp. CCGB01]